METEFPEWKPISLSTVTWKSTLSFPLLGGKQLGKLALKELYIFLQKKDCLPAGGEETTEVSRNHETKVFFAPFSEK